MALVKELEQAFFVALGGRVEEHGFQSHPRDQCYSRRTPTGRQTFHLSFIRHARDVDVTGDIAVRFDELEDLLNEGRALSKSEMKHTHSLGAELGNLSEGKQRRWTLTSPADVLAAVPSATALFEAVGLPYFEKYSDPERALDVLSGDDQDSRLHAPFHDVRAQRAVGLAYVLGDFDRLDSLIKAKSRYLQDRNDPGLPGFLTFVERIKTRAASAAKG